MLESRAPLHDYAQSCAVVMGTSGYHYLPPVPAAANSLRRMVRLLTSPLCGWPADRVLVWSEESSVGDLADRLVTAFEGVADIALFYYVGHGQIDTEDQLCLGLVESKSDPNRRASTSLTFQAVRRALLDSPAAIKIIILDCCFSGLAGQPINTLSGPADSLSGIIGGTGAYTMAASGAYNTAWYENNPEISEPQTYFTQYLVNVLEKGIPDEAEAVRLHALFTELYNNLAQDKLPLPSSRSIDGAREFPFAYNVAENKNRNDRVRRIRNNLDVKLNEINYRLVESEAREEALSARFDERSRQIEELLQQMGEVQQVTNNRRQQLLEPEMGITRKEKWWRRKSLALLRRSAFASRRRLVLICLATCVVIAAVPIVGSLIGSPAPRAADSRRSVTGPRVNTWTYQTAGPIDSGPMIAKGTVFVGSDSGIYALNAATGTLRWADASAGAVDSSPEVIGDSVYVGSFSPHEVLALDAESGRVRWAYLTGGPVESSPFVVDGNVYVGSFDHKIYALNAATGAVRWVYVTGGPVESSPFVVDDTVYVGSFDGKVYALNATTGQLRWTHATEGPIESSPSVKSGTLYVGSDDHEVYALDAASGSVRWVRETDGMVRSTPVVVGGSVFIGNNDDRVYALSAASGLVRWTYATEGPVDSSAFIAAGVVYIGSDDHKVYALNMATGHVKWFYAAKGAVQSRPVVANGALYVGSFDDKIYALDAATGGT